MPFTDSAPGVSSSLLAEAYDRRSAARAAIYSTIFAALALAVAWPATAQTATAQTGTAQAPGELFPQPFVVEHQTVHLEDDGTRFVSEPVKDTYGGSWLVTERSDGSRLVLDLARREITEIRPQQGSYWRLSFTRLAELQARIERLDEMPTPDGLPAADEAAEKSVGSSAAQKTGGATLRLAAVPEKSARRLEGAPETVDRRVGVQHFRVESLDQNAKSFNGADPAPAAEVWVDPSIRLTEQAREALSSFERDALRADRRLARGPSPLEVMKAVREQTDGAFPVRLSRRIPGGIVEDVTTRLETIEGFDLELVRVPDGLKRVPHPFESAIVFMEKEAERRELMGSLPQ